ncbi:MAG TPA: hypothetical protein EYN03_05600 [Planctomycetes bacterium]|nr:hypothetical protein [Planctomycetota bacterium]
MNDAKAPVSKRLGNKSAWVLFGLLGAAFLLALLILAPWENNEEITPQLDLSGPVLPLPPAPSSGYVGSTACRDCHEEIHDSFRRHPMGNSITHVGRASPIEDYLEKNTFASGGFQNAVVGC